MSYFSWSWH